MMSHRHLRALVPMPLAVLSGVAILTGVAFAEPGPGPTASTAAFFDLQSFVDRALARGDTTVVLPPGRHRVTPTRGVHLRLRGARDVAIVADGFEMVCTQTTRAIQIENSHGLTISGLAIDYDPLPFTQGQIVKLSADKRVHEIELLGGYPAAQTATRKKYQVFRHDDHALRWVDFFDPEVEPLSATRLRVTKKQRGPTPREEVGDWVVIGSNTDGGRTLPHAVVLESCSGVRLERLTVYASNCFAFLETDCDRTTYDRCRVAKRAARSDPVSRAFPRLRSANADAFHSKRAARGPQIIGCYAHYQGDDCVNINGDYHLVAQAEGTRLRVLAKQSMDIRTGDTIELTDREGDVLPEARVVSIRKAGGLVEREQLLIASLYLQDDLKSQRGGRLQTAYYVELDRPVGLKPGSLIAATNRRGDGFTVAECDFGHLRSRGIIVKASHGEIRDNKLSACRGESIKLAAERYWLEAGAASDVKILRNTISDGGSVAIAVYAKGASRGFASGSAHRQITIADNRILRCPIPNVFVSSTDTVRLERNRSHDGAESSASGHSLLRLLAGINASPPPILVHQCSDVVMHSNAIQ